MEIAKMNSNNQEQHKRQSLRKEIDKCSEGLPKPPIPDLETTLCRYIQGLAAVIRSKDLEQTRKVVQNFLHNDGDGKKLQDLLKEYAKTSENWVTDFWINDMYLNNSQPLVINSNPFFLLPKQNFPSETDMFNFASVITKFALLFKEQIDSDTLEQDTCGGMKRGRRLCMQTYRHFFTACRLPGEFKDELYIHEGGGSNHFIVACHNQFYMVELPGKNGKTIPNVSEFESCFEQIWNESKENSFRCHIGVLTTENRRTWYSIRKDLIKDQINKKSLDLIENSLFLLCLDDNDIPQAADLLGSEYVLHGGGSRIHTSNRWFDKFFQIIIRKDGFCGMLTEHSASEGITVMSFLERFLRYTRKSPQPLTQYNQTTCEKAQSPQGELFWKPLKWRIDMPIVRAINVAAMRVDKEIKNLDLFCITFKHYGRNYIKEQKISPDVYIQLALQLAYYGLHKKIVSTYESCSLRQFRLGRVDNIRSSTLEALDWARSMFDESSNTELKIMLFRKAIQKQTEILRYTCEGYGPDNHLIALKELSLKHHNKIPELFKLDSYKEYINFRLSTSQVFTQEDVVVGYGPVVPDGYGCSYNPKSDIIVFVLSAFKDSQETSADFFRYSLYSSLIMMKELCEEMRTYNTIK